NRPRRTDPFASSDLVPQQERDEGRLPVVDMQHLRLKGKVSREVKNRPTETDESLRIVRKITAGITVNALAVEVLGDIDEVDRQVGLRLEGPDARIHLSRS